MCTVLLPPGDNPIAVNKYIISYHIISKYVEEKTNKAIPCLKPNRLYFYLMELIVILATWCLKNPNETEEEINGTACHSTEQATSQPQLTLLAVTMNKQRSA